MASDGTLFALINANTKLKSVVGPDNERIDFDAVNDGVGLYRFRAEQQDWIRLGKGGIAGTSSDRFRWPRVFAVDQTDSSVIYIAAAEPRELAEKIDTETGLPIPPPQEAGIYRLRIQDDVWEPLESRDARNRYRYFGVYLHPDKPNWIYMTLNGQPGRHRAASGLWLSKNRGATFEQVKSFPFKHVHRVVVDTKTRFNQEDPNDAGVLYVTTNGAGVWRGPANPDQSIPNE